MTADTTENPHPAAPELASLRKAIDAIDHDMVALLKERQEQVDRVVALKRTHGLPVYHPAREENLISEKRRTARAVGLDPDFLEDIFRRILRQSRVEQTAQLARRGVKPGARVLLVGGAGAMGRGIAQVAAASSTFGFQKEFPVIAAAVLVGVLAGDGVGVDHEPTRGGPVHGQVQTALARTGRVGLGHQLGAHQLVIGGEVEIEIVGFAEVGERLDDRLVSPRRLVGPGVEANELLGG